MQRTELAPYLGRRCQVMVECDACGGTHTHEGTLAAARKPGELEIDGRTYPYGRVRALVLAPSEGEGAELGVPRTAWNVALIAGVALAVVEVLRVMT